MRFVLAFLIGIAGLILGWLVSAFGTLILGSALGLSDFEGERAMVAFFAAGPVGGLIGVILAIWLWSRRGYRAVGPPGVRGASCVDS